MNPNDNDVGSIEPVEEGFMERAGRAVQETAEAFGLSRAASRKLGGAASFVGENAPVVGDVNDANEVRRELRDGNYGSAALAGLGFIPFVGGALRKGADMTMELFRGADKSIQEEALATTARNMKRIPNPDNEDDVAALVETAAMIERRRIAEHSAKERPDVPRDGNEPVSFGRGDSLYHSTKKGDTADRIESENHLRTGRHAELGIRSASLSRDPIYSARHFGNKNVDNTFEVKGVTPDKNLSPLEYDRMRDQFHVDTGDVAVNLPKNQSFVSEHETAIKKLGLDKRDIERLSKTNPEKAKFIQEGVDKAESVMEEQAELFRGLRQLNIDNTQLSPKEAKQYYNALRDNMKEALSLAKYTEDNSARGTYDWYISNFSRPNAAVVNNAGDSAEKYLQDLIENDPTVGYEMDNILNDEDILEQYGGILTTEELLTELGEDISSLSIDQGYFKKDDIVTGLERVRDSLVGEQNKKELTRMIDSIEAFDDAGMMSSTEFGEIARSSKKLESGRMVAQSRAEEVNRLKEALEDGRIGKDEFSKRMKGVTQKYKEALQEARKSDKEDPLGFIPTAERMNKGGLVS